jgi:hypothetical protein
MRETLDTGDELRGPHCNRWHPVFTSDVQSTDTTNAMFYFTCRG